MACAGVLVVLVAGLLAYWRWIVRKYGDKPVDPAPKLVEDLSNARMQLFDAAPLFTEHLVHQSLECCRRVREAQGHHKELVEAVGCAEYVIFAMFSSCMRTR
ncbi:hypothetical protein [Oryza sativa Japonica Group]|uniref:Uncharacterized protein n=1 Tax=Oryza sativa subsp. japonica TaxID=39947 RepID=Q8W0C8_ORYSJ|nr:hypothetical protein [Oryza sativa Japonica Group]BAB89489.1 hypothetical protein [Oryza sativa Japonica Group]